MPDHLAGLGSNIGKNMETTVTVSWMGGGQVKERKSFLNLFKLGCSLSHSEDFMGYRIYVCSSSSIPQSSFKLPSTYLVSGHSSSTLVILIWFGDRAILTKYKSNRSFAEWSSQMKFDTLDYENVNSYTSELFEDFMSYKQLLKYVQAVIDNPDAYTSKLMRCLLPGRQRSCRSQFNHSNTMQSPPISTDLLLSGLLLGRRWIRSWKQ